jgi:predicted amidophosphoribosyltransferase
VDCARAIGSYEGTLRRIVHALKYEGRRSVVPGLARAMRESGALVLSGVDALVPVPLHPLRWRARGFNQADDLARAIGLPMLRLLRRAAHTPPQVDLPADARWRNVEGAFTLSRGFHRSVGLRHAGFSSDARSGLSGASGLVLVLIDDVATTGATLEACARVLKAAGAREVRALTAARVVTVHH